jgi:hypothetical protein
VKRGRKGRPGPGAAQQRAPQTHHDYWRFAGKKRDRRQLRSLWDGGAGGNRTHVRRPSALCMGYLLRPMLAQATLNRLAFARANGLRHGIAATALSPGWTRTELVVHAFKADEGGCYQVDALRRAESTAYVRLARLAPAREKRVIRESGRTLVVHELACVYSLTVRRRGRAPPFRSGCRPPRTARARDPRRATPRSSRA